MRPTTHKQTVKILFVLILIIAVLRGCGTYSSFGTYKDANRFSSGDFTYQAAGISKIEINWVAGDIKIVQSDSDQLSVTESGEGFRNAHKLHWYRKGDKLLIQYCKSGYHGYISGYKKNLTVEVPEGIELKVNTVSGSVEMAGGQIFKAIDIDTVSGDIVMDVDECRDIEIDAVSGDVTLRDLPENGAVVKYSTVSGNLNVNRPYANNNKELIFGNGGCSIDIDTVSGDLNIE